MEVYGGIRDAMSRDSGSEHLRSDWTRAPLDAGSEHPRQDEQTGLGRSALGMQSCVWGQWGHTMDSTRTARVKEKEPVPA